MDTSYSKLSTAYFTQSWGAQTLLKPGFVTLKGYYGARPVGGLDRGRLTREKAHSAPFFALNTLRYLEYATTRVKVWVPITLGVSTSS